MALMRDLNGAVIGRASLAVGRGRLSPERGGKELWSRRRRACGEDEIDGDQHDRCDGQLDATPRQITQELEVWMQTIGPRAIRRTARRPAPRLGARWGLRCLR